jgi:hypothetical protein
MAGYLDHYGEGDEKREKRWKRTLLAVFTVLVVGSGLYFTLRTYRQEQRVKTFLDHLNRKDYRSAYALWGCTEATPCRDYSFDKFIEDWGPQSPRSSVANYHISRSRSCGSGVVLTIDTGGGQAEYLWVEKRDLSIGFSPYPGCPKL